LTVDSSLEPGTGEQPTGDEEPTQIPIDLRTAGVPEPRIAGRQVDRDHAQAARPRKTVEANDREIPRPAQAPGPPLVLSVSGLVKRFDETTAVNGIDLDVRAGWFYGIVGPNGAGKTTTLSMVTGLMRPMPAGARARHRRVGATRMPQSARWAWLPDRLRLFDRLTGNQLLFYAGVLRGLDAKDGPGADRRPVRRLRTRGCARPPRDRLLGGHDQEDRTRGGDDPQPSHPRARRAVRIGRPGVCATVIEILERYVAAGGTVLLSSHSMDLVQRVCDHVAVIVGGQILAKGTMDEVRAA
jgi:ABC-2 type transport system ATP-binding protein